MYSFFNFSLGGRRGYGGHPKLVSPIHQADLHRPPDPKCLPLCGLEGQKGFYRRHEGNLHRPQPGSCPSGAGSAGKPVGKQIRLCHQKLEGPLGGTHRLSGLPAGDPKDHLHDQHHREPEWKNQKIHQKQAFPSHR